MRKFTSPYAYLLSENNYARSLTDDGVELRQLPLYAAYCIGSGYVKAFR